MNQLEVFSLGQGKRSLLYLLQLQILRGALGSHTRGRAWHIWRQGQRAKESFGIKSRGLCKCNEDSCLSARKGDKSTFFQNMLAGFTTVFALL